MGYLCKKDHSKFLYFLKKIAIITGANGNLGKFIVKKFLLEGYGVVGMVHQKKSNPAFSDENYREIEIDLLQEETCKTAIETIIRNYHTIDVAILTAGGFAMGGISNTTSANIYAQYQLNFETAYHIAQPVFLQMMHQNSGRIFFIGSRPGYDFAHAKGLTAYALSKSLLFRLSELMNKEAKGKNVVSAVIVPSIIDTPQNREAMPTSDFSEWVQPAQIADALFYYSTSQAAAIREPVIKIYNDS